jgi:hypothetical protein
MCCCNSPIESSIPSFLESLYEQGLLRDAQNLNENDKKRRSDRYHHFKMIVENRLIPRYGEDLTSQFLQYLLKSSAEDADTLQACIEGKTLLKAEQHQQILITAEKIYAPEMALRFRNEALSLFQLVNDPELLDDFVELDILAATIESEDARRQVYFELWKTLAYFRDIPSFNNKRYLANQISMLHLAIKVVKIACKRTEEMFPSFPQRPNTKFVFEGVDPSWLLANPSWGMNENFPPHPFAVYKTNGEWMREQFAWEMAFLFGFEDAFMPTIVIDLFNHRASLQPYWNYLFLWWPENKINDVGYRYEYRSLISKFALKPFIHCCLGSLLLSTYDQSFLNCRYRQNFDGSLSIINFDNGSIMPSINGFFPKYQVGPEGNSILQCLSRSFWAWFFDFPQASITLEGKYLLHAQKLVKQWQNKHNDFLLFFHHPLNNFLQGASEITLLALKQRLDIIYDSIMVPDKDTSLLSVLYAMQPLYKPLVENLKARIAIASGAPLTTLWCVNMSIPQLEAWLKDSLRVPEDEVNDFLNWYRLFAQTIPRAV